MSTFLVECARRVGCTALFLTAVGPLPVSAQARVPTGTGFENVPRVGIGYVANVPNMFLGFNTYALLDHWGGLGIYLDAKLDLDSPADEMGYIPELTRQIVEDSIGDRFFREEDKWRSFNIALVRPLGPQLMVYAGAGIAERERYWEYADPDREMGFNGFYWVRVPEESGAEIGFLGGFIFGISRNLAVQLGLESTPGGATVGGSYTFPLR